MVIIIVVQRAELHHIQMPLWYQQTANTRYTWLFAEERKRNVGLDVMTEASSLPFALHIHMPTLLVIIVLSLVGKAAH